MAVLQWDKAGERFYETGIDRGVLFTRDGRAFVWNGLTNVSENPDFDVKSYWMDGVKYLDHVTLGAYSGKMEAFTYPGILDELAGVPPYAPGVFLHNQKAQLFHLSYRTGVGNDLSQELGYKLHIVYNVLAVPSGASYGTRGETVETVKFSWDLMSTPPSMFGARPTSHIHLDSRYISPSQLQAVEALLYGTEEADPELPSMISLLSLLNPSP